MFNKEIMNGNWEWGRRLSSTLELRDKNYINEDLKGVLICDFGHPEGESQGCPCCPAEILEMCGTEPTADIQKLISAIPELLNIANEANRMILELQETGTIYIDDLEMRLEKLKEKLK